MQTSGHSYTLTFPLCSQIYSEYKQYIAIFVEQNLKLLI